MLLTGGRRCKRLLWFEFFEQDDPYGIRTCGPVDTIIDLGSHCGMFSLMARFLHPKARIMAIEPDPGNFAALSSNAAHLHIEVSHRAIGDGSPVALLNRHIKTVSMRYDRTHDSPTSGVFDKPLAEDGIAATIPSSRLQDLWEAWKPAGRVFLKMDMEGAEHHIVGDPAAEACLEQCSVIGGELHVVPDGPSMDQYREWLQTRYGSAFDVEVTAWPKARHRLAQLRMRRKQ